MFTNSAALLVAVGAASVRPRGLLILMVRPGNLSVVSIRPRILIALSPTRIDSTVAVRRFLNHATALEAVRQQAPQRFNSSLSTGYKSSQNLFGAVLRPCQMIDTAPP